MIDVDPPHVRTMTPAERSVRDAMLAAGMGDYGVVARFLARSLTEGGWVRLPSIADIAPILHEMADVDGCDYPEHERVHDDDAHVMLAVIRDAVRRGEQP